MLAMTAYGNGLWRFADAEELIAMDDQTFFSYMVAIIVVGVVSLRLAWNPHAAVCLLSGWVALMWIAIAWIGQGGVRWLWSR